MYCCKQGIAHAISDANPRTISSRIVEASEQHGHALCPCLTVRSTRCPRGIESETTEKHEAAYVSDVGGQEFAPSFFIISTVL